MRGSLGIPLLVGLAAQGVTLAAAELPDHRWNVRGNFGVNTPSDPLPGDALLAISIGRSLGSRVGVEAFLGPGLPVSTKVKDGRGGQRTVDLTSGVHGAALLKLSQKLTSRGRTLATLGAGPSFVAGGVFGAIPMARAEAGLDWRFEPSKVFSLTLGYESVLKTSRKPFEAADCLTTANCPPYYKAGSGQVSARWQIGFTF